MVYAAAPLNASDAPGIRVDADLVVRMRDGVRLAADLYRPTAAGDDPLPVLLERTPYDRRGTNHAERTAAEPQPISKPDLARRLARAGFAVLLQDCRGRYGSEGVFSKYVNEAEDGVDTVAWIRSQPWCDGQVGTFGLSYGAHVQAALACLDPPGVRAMILDSGGFSSAFHSGIRQGGAFEMKQVTWAHKHALLSPETAADPERRRALEAVDLRAWFTRRGWREGDSPLSAAPEYERYLFEQWRNGLFGPYWRQTGLYAQGCYATFTDAPMVHLSSWYDPYALTAVDNFTGLSRTKRSPVRLIMGPWTHGQRSVTWSGEVDFGADATFEAGIGCDYTAFRLAWFDRWMRDPGAPDPLPSPVTLFVMGGGSGRRTASGRLDHGGRWIRAADWPPPGAAPRVLHLHASGDLDDEPPAEEVAFRGYDYDPLRPVPTVGGALASGAPIMEAGAFDQRERHDVFGAELPGRALADRDDVLVFRTTPLPEDLEVIGPIEAELWISSTCPDTDFTIKLIDEHPPTDDYPEGFAMNLSHGVFRARYHEGFDRESLLEPGRVYRLRVRGFPTANRFLRGHRLRLDVSSSNYPHFDANPNSGEPEGRSFAPRTAHNRVFMDRNRPSRLLLSVLPNR